MTLLAQSDPVFRWLGGSLFISMSLHAALSNRPEPKDPVQKAKRERAFGSLVLLITAGWLALMWVKQFYIPAAFFLAAAVTMAWSLVRRLAPGK